MPNAAVKSLRLDELTLIIVLHNTQTPADSEWAEFMALAREAERRDGGIANARVLAITDGGAPHAKQRDENNRFLAGRKGIAAAVSDSAFVRGVVTALSWINPAVKAFSPAAFPAALEHLGVAKRHLQDVWYAVNELQKIVPTKIVEEI